MVVAISSLEDPLDRMIRLMGPHLPTRGVGRSAHERPISWAGRCRGRSRCRTCSIPHSTASLAQISVEQNDDMRKIAA